MPVFGLSSQGNAKICAEHLSPARRASPYKCFFTGRLRPDTISVSAEQTVAVLCLRSSGSAETSEQRVSSRRLSPQREQYPLGDRNSNQAPLPAQWAAADRAPWRDALVLGPESIAEKHLIRLLRSADWKRTPPRS
ncbi:hypothetical protein MRX96_055580 [Rhipicephalus microplus]